jgi:hypothetical protein
MVVDNHEYYQTNRLGPEAASGPPGSRTRLGEPVSDDMSSRTGSVNFFKKKIFRLLKFSNGIRPSTQYSRRLRPVLKHGTPQKGEKSRNAMVVYNHEYYQTEGNRL